MKVIEYVVQDEVGIHARPAGQLVKLAKSFTCSVKLQKSTTEADAKSILGVLGLGVNQGDQIKVVFDGSDEAKAYEAFGSFLPENL